MTGLARQAPGHRDPAHRRRRTLRHRCDLRTQRGHPQRRTHSETGEHDEGTEADEGTETPTAEPADGEAGENEERVLGIDLESPLVAAAVVVVRPARRTRRRPSQRLLVVIAVVAAAFAVLDIAEVVHQVDGNRTGLALLAGIATAAPPPQPRPPSDNHQPSHSPPGGQPT